MNAIPGPCAAAIDMNSKFKHPVKLPLIWLLFMAIGAGALAAEKPLELSDLQGKRHAPLARGEGKPVALIFISPYCPSSNAFLPEINRIAAKYGDRVAFYLVQSDVAVTKTDAVKQAEMYGVTTPMLLDNHQSLAKAMKASVTPEAIVISASGAPLYQGRINDLYLSRTRKQPEPKTHDLIAALDAILAGQPVPTAPAKAIGCSISTVE